MDNTSNFFFFAVIVGPSIIGSVVEEHGRVQQPI